MNSYSRILITTFSLVMGVLVFSSSAHAATSTVCPASCDFTTLQDAVNADLPGQDSFVLATGYDVIEPQYLILPPDSILACDPGVTYGTIDDNGGGGYTNTLASNNNVVIRDCQFEDIVFYTVGVNNVTWLNNTFSTTTTAYLALQNSDNFIFSGNNGLDNISLLNIKNGTISENSFASRNGSVSVYDSSDFVVHSNIFVNSEPTYISSSWVNFTRVTNLDFTSNTLRSVPLSGYHTMMYADSSGDVAIRDNLFLYPEDISVINGGVDGLTLSRPANSTTNIVVENNSFIGTEPTPTNLLSYTCARIYYGAQPGDTGVIDVEFKYNLCSWIDAPDIAAGIGFHTYSGAINDLSFSDEYNSFFGTEQPIGDYDNDNYIYVTSTLTLSPTTLYQKPVFRQENADTSDDYHFVPMSRHLDVNGTRDIGAFAGSRINTYTIDDDCVVDYTNCHSQMTSILTDVLMSGDTAYIESGVYPDTAITGPLSNFIIQGAGTSTVFDGAVNNQSALSITNVTSSSFNDLRLVNSTDGIAPLSTIDLTLLSFGGNDYDAFGGVLFLEDSGPATTLITTDDTPISIDGLTSINGFLLDVGGAYYTILAPENVADSAFEMEILLGEPPTHFIEDLFIANGDGTYSYNSTNLDNQGITLMIGMTPSPAIVTISPQGSTAALRLDNATNITFERLTIENNDVGVSFLNGSTGNTIEASLFADNPTADIVSDSVSGINDLINTSFTRTLSDIVDGTVRVFYTSSVLVTDPLSSPLENVLVDFVSANNLVSVSTSTNALGLTPEIMSLAYLMTPASIDFTNGGYNPFNITAHATSSYPTTSTLETLSEMSQFEIMMNVAPIITPPVITSGGGGGSLPSIDPRTGTYPPIAPVAPTTVMTIEPRIHMLVKLLDDGNPETQEDSTVYYLGADSKRHLFPNQSVFNSWYCDFSRVVSVDPSTLAKYPIGMNVTYRPGLNMVKFPTNPNVYVVQPGRVLRHIKDEAAAISMFSLNWAKLVYDLSDTTYGDYVFGDELPPITDLSILNQSPSYPSGEMNIEGYLDIVTGGQACR